MSERFIKKNIKLSLEFDKYVSKHPDAIAKIPRGAYVILIVKGDEKFNRDSRSLIQKSRTKKYVEAKKEGMKWTIQPLAV